MIVLQCYLQLWWQCRVLPHSQYLLGLYLITFQSICRGINISLILARFNASRKTAACLLALGAVKPALSNPSLLLAQPLITLWMLSLLKFQPT